MPQPLHTVAPAVTETVLPIVIGYPAEMAARAAAETLISMHLVHTIRPWHRRFEKAFDRQLFTKEERRQGYYTKFIDGEFLRATAKDRAEYNKVALGGGGNPGWANINDVRGWDDMDEVPNGNHFYAPVNVGPIAAVYVAWMIAIGISATMLAAANHRIPPFFEPSAFMVMDWTYVLVFAGLTWSAVRLRTKSDWHRRLMLSGAIVVMAPGLARLVPLPLLGGWIYWGIWAGLAVYFAIAMAWDIATRRSIHPAYFWGLGAITLGVALIRPIASSPPLLALTERLTG